MVFCPFRVISKGFGWAGLLNWLWGFLFLLFLFLNSFVLMTQLVIYAVIILFLRNLILIFAALMMFNHNNLRSLSFWSKSGCSRFGLYHCILLLIEVIFDFLSFPPWLDYNGLSINACFVFRLSFLDQFLILRSFNGRLLIVFIIEDQ